MSFYHMFFDQEQQIATTLSTGMYVRLKGPQTPLEMDVQLSQSHRLQHAYVCSRKAVRLARHVLLLQGNCRQLRFRAPRAQRASSSLTTDALSGRQRIAPFQSHVTPLYIKSVALLSLCQDSCSQRMILFIELPDMPQVRVGTLLTCSRISFYAGRHQVQNLLLRQRRRCRQAEERV